MVVEHINTHTHTHSCAYTCTVWEEEGDLLVDRDGSRETHREQTLKLAEQH